MPKSKEELVRHIRDEYIAKGKTPEEAESIAWATVTKLENKETTDESSTDE